MTPERWQQVKQLLNAAMEQPAGARSAWLRDACHNDKDLLEEVQSLIAASDDAGDFLDQPIMEQDPIAGTRVGAYRLLEPVGRGGMGAVYRAVRDDDQFQQEVAVKVVKRGMDTDAVLARFRYERQILAFLIHPYIARLLDGGATPDGRPYLVMEFIEGLPIADYCIRNALPLQQRVQLMLKVCSAVEYAHRNLIVHRDLKPGNILINADGEPKLLDFGIAQILLPQIAEVDHNQTITLRLLTPDYASPEQVRGEPVTTVADIYSLGVILYEILTGCKAIDTGELSLTEIRRVVCEQNPPRPSDAAPHLARQLRGDLDNIVLKAMHKDAARRYSSVEQFSEDLRRHLVGLPVSAREDTVLYRAGKFITRHKVGFVSSTVMIVLLAAGAGFTAWQAREARSERDRATRWFTQGRRLANAFLVEHDALASIPGGTGLREKLMNDALAYLDTLSREAAGDPALQRELALAYEKTGDVQGRADGPNLGDTTGALGSYRKAAALREQLASVSSTPADRRDLAKTYIRLSSALKITGDYSGALSFDRKALAIHQELYSRNPLDTDARRRLLDSHNGLGGTLFHIGEWKGVLEHRQQALALARQIMAAPDPSAQDYRAYALAALRMGSMHGRNKQTDLALRHYQEALDATLQGQKAFPLAPQLRLTQATILNAIGRIRLDQGRFDDALAQYVTARAIYEQLRAADPRDIRTSSMLAGSHYRIGVALTRSGQPARALSELQRSLDMRETLAAADQANAGARGEVAESLAALADAQLALHRKAPAIPLYQRARTLFEELEARRQANPDVLDELARVRARLAELAPAPPQ